VRAVLAGGRYEDTTGAPIEISPPTAVG
jgi:hypothetical protein